ncbi:acyltransferase [Lachnoclostridium sp. An169]|uniref:acyltransferase family protein n=1 Tax=Lachnoclostridium sp. An169 TaxID=1965569 RepID=UPI000B39098F|nr:acyltransferase [Lachnoclostridium sp. An169]OUP80856.1 acyltransferase [Lachnoclostridium sp. An169]
MEVKRKYYGAIDGLRTYAALGIALMHIKANGNYQIPGFISESLIGTMGEFVFLFMIISGFSMCCGYYERIINNQITIGEFYSKRYKKIWPYFAVLCLLDFIISPSLPALYETFANLTLCFGLLPNANISVIGVGWFLGVVFVFYLIFPFFAGYLLQNKRRAWCSFVIALVFNILCQIYFFNSDHMIAGFDYRSNFLYCSVYFLAGGLIFLYRERLSELCGKLRIVSFTACILAAVVFFSLGKSTFTLLLLCSLLLVYAIGNYKRARILENRFTHFISGISMEIYLCHMMMFRIVEKLHLTHIFNNEVAGYIVTAVITLAFAVVFSVVMKKVLTTIENNMFQKVKKL